MKMKWVWIFFLSVSFMGCATSYTEDAGRRGASEPLPVYPEFKGEKIVAAVLPLGLSERAALRYPHLLEQSVGMGIHNLVIEALFRSGRFRFVEEKPEIIKDMMNRQWMSAAGFVSSGTAAEYGKMLGAEKVIYGEVFDYAQGGEEIKGLSAGKNRYTQVGVQVICTDVATGEKIALGTATAVEKTYGDASRNAVEKAVYSLVKRIE